LQSGIIPVYADIDLIESVGLLSKFFNGGEVEL